MNPALLIKLRPTTPWRIAPPSGSRTHVDAILHSDTLYSAITLSMRHLGLLEEWLQATATAQQPAVRFSSCYPFHGGTLFIAPPRNLWPPPSSSRVRWKAARFVPLRLVESLVNDPQARAREEDWVVDGESECLLPAGRSGRAQGPFQMALRRTVAVDRLTGVCADPDFTASLEFAAGSGLWCVAVFSSEESRQKWSGPLQSALRLLADSGFGGERSRGWGRAEAPEFIEGAFPDLVLTPAVAVAAAANGIPTPAIAVPQEPESASPDAEQALPAEESVAVQDPETDPETPSSEEVPAEAQVEPQVAPSPTPSLPAESAYWLLSLFRAGEDDAVDWSRGAYALVERSGRIDSPFSQGELKRSLSMVSEGSVVFASVPPNGSAPDVSPEGFAHPVYRAGFALAIPIHWRVVA